MKTNNQKKNKKKRKNYRRIKRNTAFLLIYAISGLRNSDTREVGSKEVHGVQHSLGKTLRFEEKKRRERRNRDYVLCPKLVKSVCAERKCEKMFEE